MIENYLNDVILGVNSPRWSNKEKTAIDVNAKFSWSNGEYITFTASQNDVMDYGKVIYSNSLEGKYGFLTTIMLLIVPIT